MPAATVLRVVGEAMGVAVEAFGERRRQSVLRAVAIRLLLRHAGLNQRQVAEILGMGTGAAVSWQARRCVTLQASDCHLRRTVQAVARKLQTLSSQKRTKQ